MKFCLSPLKLNIYQPATGNIQLADRLPIFQLSLVTIFGICQLIYSHLSKLKKEHLGM